jgi:hypothetical protein
MRHQQIDWTNPKRFDLSKWKVGWCKYFKEGRCKRGERCAFAHGRQELRKKTDPLPPHIAAHLRDEQAQDLSLSRSRSRSRSRRRRSQSLESSCSSLASGDSPSSCLGAKAKAAGAKAKVAAKVAAGAQAKVAAKVAVVPRRLASPEPQAPVGRGAAPVGQEAHDEVGEPLSEVEEAAVPMTGAALRERLESCRSSLFARVARMEEQAALLPRGVLVQPKARPVQPPKAPPRVLVQLFPVRPKAASQEPPPAKLPRAPKPGLTRSMCPWSGGTFGEA